ncbi:MAG: polymer-forming cytoskeletal protein [Bacteroidetes bacterium]|nr:polymer-forming cytoskeletal protein [Bacteroidota bacterium]
MKKEKARFESPDRLNRIVEGTRIVGELIADSNIRIDGEVHGNVACAGKVVLGENGIIKGNLTCNEADIEGNIEGDLNIDILLCLKEKSKIIGNINTAKIEVNQGAIFLGNCTMGGAPQSKGVNVQNKKNQPEDIVY